MPLIYARVGPAPDETSPEIMDLADRLVRQYHPDLRMNVGSGPGEEPQYVRLCILLAADPDKPDGEPCLKDGAYPAVGAVSVIPYKQRVDKRADAEIILDESHWRDLPDGRRRALLDHLINHLEIKTKENVVQTDDAGRPKLQLRPCDWLLKGWRVIAQRYGADAPEVAAVRAFAEKFGAAATPDGEALFV